MSYMVLQMSWQVVLRGFAGWRELMVGILGCEAVEYPPVNGQTAFDGRASLCSVGDGSFGCQ